MEQYDFDDEDDRPMFNQAVEKVTQLETKNAALSTLVADSC